MRRFWIASTLASVFMLSVSACGSAHSSKNAEGPPAPAPFSSPARIDNAWFPLVPGTQFVLEGRANRGHGLLPHRLVFTVTDLTKLIDGVKTRVLWDRDYNNGELVEDELAFHAQDDAGTVWNFGEYPEEWEQGRPTGAPDTWITGLAGSRAGILMPAKPRLGDKSYLQGWAPTIDFADRAQVYRTGQQNCVPYHCYDDVLVNEEWNPSEKGEHQLKYYAQGVGNIRVGFAGGKEREGLALAAVVHLSPNELAAARAEALKLDQRARETSKKIYGRTPPAEYTGPA